jgi:hypothetical protein
MSRSGRGCAATHMSLWTRASAVRLFSRGLGNFERACVAASRAELGTRSAASAAKKRTYPQNSSSPPSPVSATVTLRRVSIETIDVGIADASPNGPS